MDRTDLEHLDRDALLDIVLQQQETLERVVAEIAGLETRVGRPIIGPGESASQKTGRLWRRTCWRSRWYPRLAAFGPGASVRVRLALAVAAVVAAILAVLVTPAPGGTGAAGALGLPRLALYGLGGLLLGLGAPGLGLTVKLRPDSAPGRAYLVLGLGVAASVAVILVAIDRLMSNIADPLGPPLWGAAMLLLGVVVALPWVKQIGWRDLWPLTPDRLPPRSDEAVPSYQPWQSWLGPLLLVVLLGIATILRLVALGTIPLGINPDEGDRAVSAFSVLNGTAPASWFDSGWYFINMIYFRVLAVSFFLFGSDVAGGRVLSGLAGMGFVATIAWFGIRNFGWRTGLLAASFATGLGITIQHSRVIAESGPTGLLWALSIGGFLEGARTGRLWAWALAGLTGGLSVYFYPSARLWVVGAVLTVFVLLIYQRDRRLLLGVVVAMMATLVASGPFLVHLQLHPDEATVRYLQTAVIDPNNQKRLSYLTPPEPLLKLFLLQTERTLGMFDRYADGGGFFPTGRPLLGKPLAQIALVGAIYMLVAAVRDVRLAILSVWFWLGLSGVLLTVETPNMLRAVGMLPSLCFVLALPLVDLVERVLAWRPGPWSALPNVACAALAVVLITPEITWYFATFRTMPSGWAPMNREGQIVATLGATGPVYTLEVNEHAVNSGWVRLLAPEALRGRVPNPGRELPALATSTSSEHRPEMAPTEGQTMSVLISGDVNQRPYLPLLQQLYPGGVVRDVGDGRRAFQVSSEALAATRGVTMIGPDGARRDVAGFGEIPPDLAAPARLTWRAGVLFPRGGRYRLTPVSEGHVELRLDELPLTGVTSGAGVDVLAATGMHFVELIADVTNKDQHLELSLTDPDGMTRPLAPTETYRLMDAPWGLLGRLTRGSQSQAANGPANGFLDATIAMTSFDPMPSLVSVPNSMVWSGSLLVPRTGVYRMAFASEDPMHLEIDGQPVNVVWVKPEQWESVGTGSEVRLTEGRHTVRVTLEITHGGRELARWNWAPPTASGASDTAAEWSLVPPPFLRPDPPVQQAPGAPR